MRNFREELIELLENDEVVLCDAVHACNQYNGSFDEEVCYPMEMLDEMLYGLTPLEILNKVTDDFSTNDEYFYFTIYGVESCDEEDYSHLTTEVADVIIDDVPYSYWDSEIKELFDDIEYENNEEEE